MVALPTPARAATASIESASAVVPSAEQLDHRRPDDRLVDARAARPTRTLTVRVGRRSVRGAHAEHCDADYRVRPAVAGCVSCDRSAGPGRSLTRSSRRGGPITSRGTDDDRGSAAAPTSPRPRPAPRLAGTGARTARRVGRRAARHPGQHHGDRDQRDDRGPAGGPVHRGDERVVGGRDQRARRPAPACSATPYAPEIDSDAASRAGPGRPVTASGDLAAVDARRAPSRGPRRRARRRPGGRCC